MEYSCGGVDPIAKDAVNHPRCNTNSRKASLRRLHFRVQARDFSREYLTALIFHGTEGCDEIFNRAQQFGMTDHKVDRRGFILGDDRPIALMNEYLDISLSGTIAQT